MISKINNKTKTLLIGTLIGAMIGITASYMLLKKPDSHEATLGLTRGQGVKIGLGVLGLLKLVSDLSEDKA
jgi:hypothetical protein